MKFLPKTICLGLTVVLALAGLSACHLPVIAQSQPKSLEFYQQAVDSWRGAEVEEVLAAWPRAWFRGQTSLADDSRIYSFFYKEEFYQQAEQYYDHAHNEWVEKTPAGQVVLLCETKFITNPEGVILEIRPGNYQCGQIAPPPARAR